MPLRLRVSGFIGCLGGKKHLGQLFNYLKSAHSGPGSQPGLRLARPQLLLQLESRQHQQVFGPGKKTECQLKTVIRKLKVKRRLRISRGIGQVWEMVF